MPKQHCPICEALVRDDAPTKMCDRCAAIVVPTAVEIVGHCLVKLRMQLATERLAEKQADADSPTRPLIQVVG